MVKIEAPTQDGSPADPSQENNRHPQVKLGNAPVDSEAITEDGIAPELPDASEIEAGDLKSGFANPPPAPDLPFPNSDLSDQGVMAGPPPTWQDNENWQSEKTQRTRHIAMIVTIALSSLSVTALTFGWFLRLQKTDPVDIAQTLETPVAEASDVVEEEPSEVVEPDQSFDTAIDDSPDPFAATAESDAMPEPDLGKSTPTEPAIDTQTVIPSSLIPTSPIESTDEVDAEEFGGSTMTELPAGLQQFMPQTLQQGPAEETSLKAPPSIDDVEIDAAAEEDSNTLGIEPPKPINLKRDLGFKVHFNSKGYPFPSLLLLISEMTGVPIQVDWTSFDLAGVDISKPIKVDRKARTCRQWLDTIAEQVDAEVREKEFVIVMTTTDQVFAKSETMLLDLADFGEQSESAEKVVEKFVGPEVEVEVEVEVADTDAGAVIDVMEVRERAQLRILATEMLRRMRSIAPRMPDDRAKRWMQVGDDRFIDWQPMGDVDPAELKPEPQPDTPITTAAMLRKLSSINESVCLVNWYDANRRGMRPTRLVMPRATGVSAATMLESVLDPLAMEVRRVDPKHWWVGSKATYDRLPILVYSDRLGQRREEYTRQIDRIMSADPDAVYRSAYDPVSDRMLMLLPRYVARQLFKVSQEIARR